ncbi:protein-tyrosine-phosphatase [Pseudahrensia aquimaris]|uniref:Protein-tyrosine-phosphatase n=1 Tax=Pseudahrensia aquimaris TaxID=744461 RepID=A0ABW3FG17_9HYPH
MSDQSKNLPASVLLMCNHNVIRSTMAEALMRKKFGERVFADSAGIRTGTVDPFVTAVLAELDMDMADHVPKALEELDDTWFDLVIAFSREAHEAVQETKLLEFGEVLFWPADDPTVVQGSRDQMLAAYRAVRDQISKRIDEHFAPTA